MGAALYILCCSVGSYHGGTTRDTLEKRGAERNAGKFDGHTAHCRPVILIFHPEFARNEDAIAAERQIKGWRREKKEAPIRGDYAAMPGLASRGRKAKNASPG